MVLNSAEQNQNEEHAIEIWEVKKDRLTSMQQKITEPPRILSRSAGRSSCCIFKVPQSLIDINGRRYHPQIVSIGPYHHGDRGTNMIEEHKWRFLGTMLARTQSKGLNLEDYLKAVHPLEASARECYFMTIDFSSDEFIELLIVDGCFVIEVLRKFGGLVPFETDDPLLSQSWVYSFLLRDLIRLENQIPFFILQCLFDLSQLPGEEDSGLCLSTLTLKFFNNAFQRPDEFVDKYHGAPHSTNYKHNKGKHILDFLRTSFIPDEPEQFNNISHSNTNVIQCISKLRRAGIKLQPGNDKSFLVVKFKNGTIKMPTIAIDDFTSAFLLNCVAYEQCHKDCSKHMTTYATLLDCLINTANDVEYLSDKNIIENYFGTDGEIARFINNLGKDIMFDIDRCYLSGLFVEVNHYYRNHWHAHWASFKFTYFNTPWSFVSALVLLILTVVQSFFTIISYVRPA